MAGYFRKLVGLIGFGSNKTSHREKLISAVGGFLAILLIMVITRQFIQDDVALIVASIGASAVLLFAVPHGPLSQPWSVTGGHVISGFIGISSYQLIANPALAAAAAVGLSIAAMYYLRCIHPPGGATALIAVVAGGGVHELGYMFLITPVLLNVLMLLFLGTAFNYLFPWRRYPARLMRYLHKPKEAKPEREHEHITDEADLAYALQQMSLYVDLSKDELARIYQLATISEDSVVHAQQVRLGHYYCNGEYGANWSVRQVVDEAVNPRPDKELIIYKVVAGDGRRSSGTVTREEFARWAKYEVFLNENSWQRVDTART